MCERNNESGSNKIRCCKDNDFLFSLLFFFNYNKKIVVLINLRNKTLKCSVFFSQSAKSFLKSA